MDISDEYEDACFGDVRLGCRLSNIAARMAEDPKLSLPGAMADEAELEGAYRFFNNESVEPAAILAPHIRATARRAAGKMVIVPQDTSECVFSTPREGLGRVNDEHEKRAFFLHMALVMSAEADGEIYGVGGVQMYVRTAPPRRKKSHHSEQQPEKSRESYRWWELTEEIETNLEPGTKAIHVMDREADNYLLFARMTEARMHFVIRLQYDRRIVADDVTDPTLRHALSPLTALATKTVHVSPRIPKAGKASSLPKAARDAKLEIRATSVTIRCPSTRPTTEMNLPEAIALNAVHVIEIETPEGYEPIEWRLLTTEPIDSAADVMRVVDIYDRRWVIEEYFKALKSGCEIEKRQLESREAIFNLVAVFLPIAWQLLKIRLYARRDANVPVTSALTPLQLRILQAHPRIRLAKTATLKDAWLAIARFGGHLKRNGPPGWITLGRGFLKLLMLEEGAQVALNMDHL